MGLFKVQASYSPCLSLQPFHQTLELGLHLCRSLTTLSKCQAGVTGSSSGLVKCTGLDLEGCAYHESEAIVNEDDDESPRHEKGLRTVPILKHNCFAEKEKNNSKLMLIFVHFRIWLPFSS